MPGPNVIGLLFLFKTVFCTCLTDQHVHNFNKAISRYHIQKTGELGQAVNESSGLEKTDTSGLYWTINDGGNKARLFKVHENGKIRDTLSFSGITNKDWEDLAKDSSGSLYIGDFGNNRNKRRDLKIYKVHSPVTSSSRIDTIAFTYPDQQKYPPTEENMNFDCEAFFWHKGHLYLFSKNRGNKCVKLYRLPDQQGHYKAGLVQEIFFKGHITAADISADGKVVALLDYGRIYFFRPEGGERLRLAQPLRCRRFGRARQSEALLFTGNKHMLITNEQRRIFKGTP